MSSLKITLEISTVAQLQALEAALELFAETLWHARLKDERKSNPQGTDRITLRRDTELQQGAAALLATLRDKRVGS